MRSKLELHYKVAGGLLVFVSALTLLAGFNFAQGQYERFQSIREAEYWRTVSGDELLNVKSVVPQSVVPQGEDLKVEFCREPSVRIVASSNIRTFYLDEDGNKIQVKQRQLPDGIEYENIGDNCPTLTILATQQPQEIGRYKFCQRFSFITHGHEKTATFCSLGYDVVKGVK